MHSIYIYGLILRFTSSLASNVLPLGEEAILCIVVVNSSRKSITHCLNEPQLLLVSPCAPAELSNMFDLHKLIVADFFNLAYAINNFHCRVYKIFSTKSKYCSSTPAESSKISAICSDLRNTVEMIEMWITN